MDSRGVGEPGQRLTLLVTLLEIHAGAFGESSLHTRNQGPAPGPDSVVRSFILQRVVHVKTGPFRIEEAGADPAAEAGISVGDLGIDFEAFRHAVGSPCAYAAVIFASVL